MAGVRSNKGEVNTDGYYYQLYTLLHCVDCLRNNSNVREFDIGNAVVGFGALDDVVFNASTIGYGAKITTTAIQVKHSNTSKMIDERYLCVDSRTCLHKYFESFVEIRKTISLEQLGQLVLWTNMSVADNIRDWFEDFVPDCKGRDILRSSGLPCDRYIIRSDHRQEIIQKCQDNLRKENEKASSARKKKEVIEIFDEEHWEQFFERLVFYVNVPKVAELKAYLVKSMGNRFDDLCRLVESCAVRQIATSDQIMRLFTLVNLRNNMETGPYTKLIFNDLEELQQEIQKLFLEGDNNILRVKASQDVKCTVARLITVVENCLAAESKRYLVFSYNSFNEKWNDLKEILKDSKLCEIGLRCLIISSISEVDISKIEDQLSALKVIFVGSELETNSEDSFDINCLDDQTKDRIKTRKIRLSQWQSATASEIFGEELFLKQNYSIILGMYQLPVESVLQVTVDEPPVDIHYLSRVAKLSSADKQTSVDLLNQRDFRKLVISDQPGMGKTTEMVKLCSDFRAKYQDHLVVYLHCRTAVSKWRGSVEDLVCSTVEFCSKLTNRVVEKVIQLGKVILIMDGYDEVSEGFNDTLKLIVSEISRFKFFRLYIATRPQCKDEISSILGECGLCQLEPFSEGDQLAYMKKFWNKEQILDDITQKAVDANARCIINQFRSITDGSSLIEIPLQTHMIAVIYKDRIASPDFTVANGSHSLGFIYREFVELKFMEHIKRNFDPRNAAHAEAIKGLRETFLHDHVLVAIKLYRNRLQPEDEDHLCGRIQHYGIVTARPYVSFVHYSYLQYFLALHVLTYSMDGFPMVPLILSIKVLTGVKLIYHLEENKSHHSHMKQIVRWSDDLICRFMDYLLDYTDPKVPLKRSLFDSGYAFEPPAGYVPPREARLYPDKMIELSAGLQRLSLKTIKLLFQCLITDRMFNMVELLYDSLPTQVRLCVYPFCDEHPQSFSFCMKDLKSADNLIPILKIIFNRNPNTFVMSYLKSLGYHEKSLLELMCNRDSLQLFEWFTEIIPRLSEEQHAVFLRIVNRKFDGCLITAIRCNNVELLKCVITWMKNTMTVEATRAFLTSNSVLLRFAQYIEMSIRDWSFGSDERKSVETLRIEMARTVFELFSWSFKDQLPLDSGFTSAVQSIKTSSIRRAFETLFQPDVSENAHQPRSQEQTDFHPTSRTVETVVRPERRKRLNQCNLN